MKRAFLREHGRAGLELIEESFVLLRTCPTSILALYFLGSVPFVAGLLIFCSDLSRHPDAPEHLGGATLAITALFIWMKFFHARFGGMLLARLRGEAPPSWIPSEVFRTTCLQTIIQSTGLFVLPIAAIVAFPLGWVYAFYQNVSALDDGRTGRRELFQSAAQQSRLWPKQNHVFLFVLSGFGFFVFLNWISIGFFTPQLLKMFFGIESAFTQSPLSTFNTTFFAVTIALTYLSVDPLIKTCYVLRCFYGRSLQSGDDLKTEVRRLSGRIPAFAACLLFCFFSPALQAEEKPSAPPPTVASAELNESIGTVIQQGKYNWRAPRKEVIEKKEEGLLSGFLNGILETGKKTMEAIGDFLDKISDWFFRADRSSPRETENSGWAMPNLGLLFVILGLVACGLAIAILRMIRIRQRNATGQAVAMVAIPDLEDENTAADELPEDDWTKLGRRFLEQGELRLALRAFYLASLAHLAARGLITIARASSNRDYERTLRRRCAATPEIPALFGENVGIFDRIWYGLHEVNAEILQRFIGNVEKMKGTV
jgi:hypothetical protein